MLPLLGFSRIGFQSLSGAGKVAWFNFSFQRFPLPKHFCRPGDTFIQTELHVLGQRPAIGQPVIVRQEVKMEQQVFALRLVFIEGLDLRRVGRSQAGPDSVRPRMPWFGKFG